MCLPVCVRPAGRGAQHDRAHGLSNGKMHAKHPDPCAAANFRARSQDVRHAGGNPPPPGGVISPRATKFSRKRDGYSWRSRVATVGCRAPVDRLRCLPLMYLWGNQYGECVCAPPALRRGVGGGDVFCVHGVAARGRGCAGAAAAAAPVGAGVRQFLSLGVDGGGDLAAHGLRHVVRVLRRHGGRADLRARHARRGHADDAALRARLFRTVSPFEKGGGGRGLADGRRAARAGPPIRGTQSGAGPRRRARGERRATDYVLVTGEHDEKTDKNNVHRSWQASWVDLVKVRAVAASAKGNILIPAFAVGRTQELLYAFKRNYERWDLDQWTVFVDSPMAIAAPAAYSAHLELVDREAADEHRHNGDLFTLPNQHLSQTALQSMRINRIESGAIIIAGSGMCEGGRIRHHLKHNVWRERCHVLIVGYQAQGTLGRALVDGGEFIKLWGEELRVSAKIHTIGGFSAHADCEWLGAWNGAFGERPPVALVHGETRAMDVFAERLRTMGAHKVFTPQRGDQIDLLAMVRK